MIEKKLSIEEIKARLKVVCICKGIKQARICDAIEKGADTVEKVNKVKAAIRKAMVEKNETPVKDNTPLTTLNDVIAKNEGTPGSSFFDNL
jgi:hypothetical protein